jgi:hypothetical protein
MKTKMWPYYTNVYYKYIHGSFNIDNEILILHNINFEIFFYCRVKKPKLIPKIKCAMLLKQLYYMYNNIKPKNVPKRITVMCFHPYSSQCWL